MTAWRPPAEALAKGASQHKYDHGHALVVSGPFAQTGAARLAARAALRVGAGLVTLAAPGGAMMECATQLTAIMLRRCDDRLGLETLLQDRRINALCLGPALGLDTRGEDILAGAVAAGRPCVLDADALTLLSRRADLWPDLGAKTVLTPHHGEFKRLFPDLSEDLEADESRAHATQRAAERMGCTVLLKGSRTIIASPGSAPLVQSAEGETAAPWLATAGSGDVLAGLIAGLLARGQTARQSARIGVWLHQAAGHVLGPGLIAEDLPEAIPGVLRRLLEKG
ncbi:ADP-dependent (S)-NAD(P)H-hydrate dehydratase [Jannaschia pagri]|uniref:ADP-dependent (S)-NAD(P)H-hydrate dehydratase n=1 Tax=Jannaschia pagri TaxID=2829797 RepID=A0ABQ4NR49_9RHOB|nr:MULTISPECIES: NAD(P)H-hydrate dehydratase [unclassified Jannaschia]GIT93055.1 ADP-dependent (S)-NAD(P)H-hydrate dehydratase [Jannaschia sp. AI_61]GIT96890.1 ADP-dependent (S)-NAD(P)H-hydrate dehydratase [Jannaschia sp. AI_62]